MPLAHAFGMPIEELMPALASGGGAMLLAVRAWIGRRRGPTPAAPRRRDGERSSAILGTWIRTRD